uniref:Putative glycosylphosphatidylinositol (GPI) anchor n=1 Tax=Trypanosoma vivax (strain Y486) TaxID=1055687 RepID=G0TU70_TRYVY|nr:putative glycosylphosphatidylinositol (GPI) anchor, fragment [Trypanosoma vivax Y486]
MRGGAGFPLSLLVVCCAVFGLARDSAVIAKPQSSVPRTEKKYVLHVHPLTEGLDDAGEEPTLVSITMKASLWLPHGSAMDDDEHLSFNEDMDPFWVYVLRRRRFDTIEWSGCGGSWRPEWSAILHDRKYSVDKDTTELIHDLSHHSVCFLSALSACGYDNGENTGYGTVLNYTVQEGDTEARQHQQWLAQFISSLLSSPLTWTSDTPRHVRPIGALRSVSNLSGVTNNVKRQHWCSYHLAQHDALCTQHISALLKGGRIFRAGIFSILNFFSSRFHHFRLDASQIPLTGENGGEEAEITLSMRMAFVVHKADFDTMSSHWKTSLPAYADRLYVVLGGSVNQKLSSAIKTVAQSTKVAGISGRGWAEQGKKGDVADDVSKPATFQEVPTVHHYISSVGYDRGTYRLVVHPTRAAAGPGAGDARYGLSPGDTLEALVFFPLHIIRPSLYAMRSHVEGSAKLENVFFDDSANVLVVLVKVEVTEAHLRGGFANMSSSGLDGFVLSEFPYQFGWAGLKDMPHDANSNRILPQPLVRVGRRLKNTGSAVIGNRTLVRPHRCEAPKCTSISSMRIDHQASLERLMESLLRSAPEADNGVSCMCHYWVRCSNVAGTTIPVPDPAMVFNVVTIGLIFSALVAGGVTRSSRELFGGIREVEKRENRLVALFRYLRSFKK